MRLGRIGFDNVAGYLEGGLHSLDKRPELIASVFFESMSKPSTRQPDRANCRDRGRPT